MPYLRQMKPAAPQLRPSQQGRIVGGHVVGPDLVNNRLSHFRGEGNNPLDRLKNPVGVSSNEKIRQGPRRLTRILGNENPDPFPRNMRIQDSRFPDGLLRQPEGHSRGSGHGLEIVGCNPQRFAGNSEVGKGPHTGSRSCPGV